MGKECRPSRGSLPPVGPLRLEHRGEVVWGKQAAPRGPELEPLRVAPRVVEGGNETPSLRGSACSVDPLLLLEEVVPGGWWGLMTELAQGLCFPYRARGCAFLCQVSRLAASVARYEFPVVRARFRDVV